MNRVLEQNGKKNFFSRLCGTNRISLADTISYAFETRFFVGINAKSSYSGRKEYDLSQRWAWNGAGKMAIYRAKKINLELIVVCIYSIRCSAIRRLTHSGHIDT